MNNYSKQVLAGQIRDTLDAKVDFWRSQLDQEITSLLVAQSTLLDDTDLRRLYVMWDNLSVYQRQEAVKAVSSRLMNLKMQYEIAGSVRVYLSERKKVISSGRFI